MKFIYRPFGIAVGLLAGLISKKIFNAIWGIFDQEEPPTPTTLETTWPKVIGAAAVQGVTFRVTRAVVDRYGAKGFAAVTGAWPGERKPDPSQASKLVR